MTSPRQEPEESDRTGGFGDAPPPRYVLRLYVAGLTPASTVAVARVKAVCEESLPGRYDLEVVDIYQQPQLAAKAQIVAVPTLVKELPGPLRKLIGDLSNKDRLLVGLGLEKRVP